MAIVTRPRAGLGSNGAGPNEFRDDDFSFGTNVLDMASLKHALYATEAGARAYVIYEDMVTPGLYEAFYRRVSEEAGVYFTKGRLNGIADGDAGGWWCARPLAARRGRRAARRSRRAGRRHGARPTADSDVLHLMYLQGPGLPTAKFGFSDSNFICFPYETRRTGIYAAGTVREPMDARSPPRTPPAPPSRPPRAWSSSAAAGPPIPAAGDLSLPATRTQGCTQCGRCSQECPFSAIELDATGFPALNPERCRRCGICMGACPVQVISFEDYSVQQLSATLKAIDFGPDKDVPRIVALACENDAYPAFDLAGINRLELRRRRAGRAAALPRVPQRGRRGRRSVVGHRRDHAHGLQVRRRLPVPLHPGLGARRQAAGERAWRPSTG